MEKGSVRRDGNTIPTIWQCWLVSLNFLSSQINWRPLFHSIFLKEALFCEHFVYLRCYMQAAIHMGPWNLHFICHRTFAFFPHLCSSLLPFLAPFHFLPEPSLRLLISFSTDRTSPFPRPFSLPRLINKIGKLCLNWKFPSKWPKMC